METYNREYRSSIFAMLFNDKKELLSLYNALNGTGYEDYDAITVNTLESDGRLRSTRNLSRGCRASFKQIWRNRHYKELSMA